MSKALILISADGMRQTAITGRWLVLVLLWTVLFGKQMLHGRMSDGDCEAYDALRF